MTEQEWLQCHDLRKMLNNLRGKAVATKRKLQLFGCACCGSIWSHIPEGLPRSAVECSERLADGLPTEREEEMGKELYALWHSEYMSSSRKQTPQYQGLWAAFLCKENGLTEIMDEVLGPPFVIARIIAHQKAGQDYGNDESINHEVNRETGQHVASILRDIIPKLLARRSPRIDSKQLTRTVVALAQSIYDERAFDRLPILGDALEEAGCQNAEILTHCREPGPHFRGCWALDLLLGKR
jgi:hypothetical protein